MTAALNYDIRWVEQTFHSRPVTEALLRPEHESGNITANDYELATRFLPGLHRHYRVLGGVVTIPFVHAIRKPGWSKFKTYAALTAGYTIGFMIGHTISVLKHVKFVHSLENPIGFSGALENVQRNTGAIMHPGPVIIRRPNHVDQYDSDGMNDVPEAAVQAVSVATPLPTTPRSASKWEQIRASNARSNPLSSWEAIRQNQEKARLSKSGVSADVGGEDQPRSHPKDRVADQAEFDVMLERERRMSTVNDNYTKV